MSFIVNAFNTIFFEPLLNGLVFLIGIMPMHDVGLAVIAITIIVRLIIFPLNHSMIVNQVKIKQLEPEIKSIKDKFKKDSQEQAKKTMELYRSHGINPFSGFITILIQLPIIFALYKIFASGINFDPSNIYSFISIPADIETNFFNLFDVTEKSYVMALITGVTQFIQMRLAIPPIKKTAPMGSSFKDDLARSMNVQMRYVMPIVIIFIASRFNAAIPLYWTTMNIFAIVHETIVRRKTKKMFKNNGNSNSNSNNKINDRADVGKNVPERGSGDI